MGINDLQYNNVIAAQESEVSRIRYPNLLFTDSYLEDPIEYRKDERFQPTTIVRQLTTLPNQLERDYADFLQVDGNDETPQLLTVNMFSSVVRRDLYFKVFQSRSQFTQFGVTQ